MGRNAVDRGRTQVQRDAASIGCGVVLDLELNHRRERSCAVTRLVDDSSGPDDPDVVRRTSERAKIVRVRRRRASCSRALQATPAAAQTEPAALRNVRRFPRGCRAPPRRPARRLSHPGVTSGCQGGGCPPRLPFLSTVMLLLPSIAWRVSSCPPLPHVVHKTPSRSCPRCAGPPLLDGGDRPRRWPQSTALSWDGTSGQRARLVGERRIQCLRRLP